MRRTRFGSEYLSWASLRAGPTTRRRRDLVAHLQRSSTRPSGARGGRMAVPTLNWARRISQGNAPCVIDARSTFEFKAGHIAQAPRAGFRILLKRRACRDKSPNWSHLSMPRRDGKGAVGIYGYRNATLLTAHARWREPASLGEMINDQEPRHAGTHRRVPSTSARLRPASTPSYGRALAGALAGDRRHRDGSKGCSTRSATRRRIDDP